MVCISNTCSCTIKTHFSNGSACLPKPTFNQTCNGAGQCYEERFLYCISGRCQCNTTIDSNGDGRAYSSDLDVCLPCPSGWAARKSYCYFLNQNNLNFTDAQSYCSSFNSFLITIDSDEEFSWIKTFIVSMIGNVFHVGGRSSTGKDMRWLYDNTNLSSLYIREIYQGHPHEPCMLAVNILGNPGLIDDALCTDLVPFVCQKYVTPCSNSQYWNGSSCVIRIGRGGSCTINPQCQSGFVCISGICSCAPPVYGQFGGTTIWQPTYSRCMICPYGWTVDTDRCILLSSDFLTHFDAATFCSNNGGRLINLITTDDYNVAKKYSSRWVGALPTTINGARVWQWADGSTVNSSFWSLNQPDNYGGNENCSHLDHANVMNDAVCTANNLKALCERIN